MSFIKIEIESDKVAKSVLDDRHINANNPRALARELVELFNRIASGNEDSKIKIRHDADKASCTLTVSSTGSSNDETMSVCGVTFTAKTSGATGNQFNISSTPATQASNMATAINASSDVNDKIVASVDGAVVTLTALEPGYVGNGLEVSETLSNVALSANGFVNGDEELTVSIDRGN